VGRRIRFSRLANLNKFKIWILGRWRFRLLPLFIGHFFPLFCSLSLLAFDFVEHPACRAPWHPIQSQIPFSATHRNAF